MPLVIFGFGEDLIEVGVVDVGLIGGGVARIHEEVEEIGADEGVIGADRREEGGGGEVFAQVGGKVAEGLAGVARGDFAHVLGAHVAGVLGKLDVEHEAVFVPHILRAVEDEALVEDVGLEGVVGRGRGARRRTRGGPGRAACSLGLCCQSMPLAGRRRVR